MSKKLLLIAITFALAGCKTFNGQFNATEKLTFNKKNGTVTVEVGQRDAKISFPNKKEVKLEISVAGNNNNPEIIFKVPKNAQLPQQNGAFELKSTDSGQPYDVAGNISTEITESEERWGTESCTYIERERRCYQNQNGQYVCHYYEYTRHGYREVRYFDRTEHQTLTFDLISADRTRTASTFDGDAYETQRIYTYQSYCR